MDLHKAFRILVQKYKTWRKEKQSIFLKNLFEYQRPPKGILTIIWTTDSGHKNL